jgi:hypothetical protein
MSALHASPAVPALAAVNVELAVNHGSRNLDLILMVYRLVGQTLAGAMRTLFRQRDVDRFINVKRNRSALMLAILVARLATGWLRIGLGRPFRKRSGLPLARPALFVELRLKQGDLPGL